MIHSSSAMAVGVFLFFVAVVLGISFYLGAKAKSAQGYFAAHGQIPWFVNGVAFAGDYLSAASFLGICGTIALSGYDGFLYSIGFLAGWVVALFVVAEPLKRLGRFTFADALDSQFNSRGIKLAAAISTLVVSVFYLIPQMVGAGTLITPLLGFPHWAGVLIVGTVVTLIVITAGMVSTTWVQFIKGSLLVVFCLVLTVMILQRGVTTSPHGSANRPFEPFRVVAAEELKSDPNLKELPAEGAWEKVPFVRFENRETGKVEVWHKADPLGEKLSETQVQTVTPDKKKFVNGYPQGVKEGERQLRPVGNVARLASGESETGPLGPFAFLRTLQESEVVLWDSKKIVEPDKTVVTVYFQKPTAGAEMLTPGGSPEFQGVRGDKFYKKLDFLSLMLALFAGTASLPHILIRYYTVKDQAAARKSTFVGIACIGFFYVLTLYIGLGAMISGTLDVSNKNMAAPLLAKSFGELPFAVISAIAFTTVLGTVSGLIMAASGAVAHDLAANVLRIEMTDHQKVRVAKLVAIVVGVIAMALGIVFEKMNVAFLVAWAFNLAASANLPALVMLLFWKGTTKQGVTAAILVGLVSSLAWILLSEQAFKDVYGLPIEYARVPFSQPGIVTIPLGFVVLVAVSLVTKKPAAR